MDSQNLFNRKQLAEWLGVSERTVSSLCKRGMPFLLVGAQALRVQGCNIRFFLPDVIEWLRNRRENALKQA
jgi:phage terminase Nu1 subunit (DNA packaging protein)